MRNPIVSFSIAVVVVVPAVSLVPVGARLTAQLQGVPRKRRA